MLKSFFVRLGPKFNKVLIVLLSSGIFISDVLFLKFLVLCLAKGGGGFLLAGDLQADRHLLEML